MSHDTEGSNPHTSSEEGHPAGEGERTDRDVGGPTAPESPPDDDDSAESDDDDSDSDD
jgi:hypothetical protein